MKPTPLFSSRDVSEAAVSPHHAPRPPAHPTNAVHHLPDTAGTGADPPAWRNTASPDAEAVGYPCKCAASTAMVAACRSVKAWWPWWSGGVVGEQPLPSLFRVNANSGSDE